MNVRFHGGPIAGQLRAYPDDQGRYIILPCSNGSHVDYERDESDIAKSYFKEFGEQVYQCVFNGMATTHPQPKGDAAVSEFVPFLRPDTNDAEIWESVCVYDCYRLPERMDDWLVLDVGAHVGSFSRAACDRGAVVWAFEPARECIDPYVRNTDGCRVTLSNVAIGSTDRRATLMHCPDMRERSGHSISIPHPNWGRSEEVDVMSFARAVATVTELGTEIDLCKLDCEGAEYDIINGTADDVLRRVKRWVIEFHAFDHFAIPWGRMDALGYKVRWRKDSPHFIVAWFDREDVK